MWFIKEHIYNGDFASGLAKKKIIIKKNLWTAAMLLE